MSSCLDKINIMRTFKLLNNNNKDEALVTNSIINNKKHFIDVVCYNPNGHSLNTRLSRKVRFSSLPHISSSNKPSSSKSRRLLPQTPSTRNLFNRLISVSGHFTPEPDTDHDIGALSSKYSGLADSTGDQERNSPPKSPPPFSKAESRFEREQRIRVGSLDSYTPGGTLQRQKR